MVVIVDVPEETSCDDSPHPTSAEQVNATSSSSVVLEHLITSLGTRISDGNSHGVHSLGVTTRSGTRSRNQRLSGSGGSVTPPSANS